MGTDHIPAKPTLSRNARGKLSRSVINKTIPAILRSDARARRGVETAELIVDPPAPDRPRKIESGFPAGPADPQTKISLTECDTLVAARNLAESTFGTANFPNRGGKVKGNQHHRIAILNMASPLRPGGGVLSGATSQEESICRRTTLYPSLKEEFYRLPEVGGVYTPDALVFYSGAHRSHRKDTKKTVDDDEDEVAEDEKEDQGESEGETESIKVDEKKDWFYVDVVTAAILRFPDLVDAPASSEDGAKGAAIEKLYANQSDREMVVRKLRAVMRILRSKGVQQVVLGAWGCGAYGNPVGEIARAWKKVLLGDSKRKDGEPRNKPAKWPEEYSDIEVVFAIKDRKMADAFAAAWGAGLCRVDREADGSSEPEEEGSVESRGDDG
ncbi:hypothetical protein QBC37DRAFT_418979 [Rhypophila decipiens]|uniref:Microbial-type PARG catalytic domain-containing protein n=1 Tax=Rhypophila decipiens TaxID=261697 RepID=A0AAN7B9H6_9PEZI|nr:hypothetical protein QBC37DRAFT_418979 [Rhypophila decipiens]